MAITELNKPSENAPPPIGHNKPPVEEEAKAAFDEIIDSLPGFRQRIEDLIGAADRATATSEETLDKCSETVKQIRAATNVVNDAHKTAKAPYLEGGRVIDAEKNAIAGRLAVAKQKVEDKQTVYVRKRQAAEQERQEKERQRIAEEQRVAREAEQARLAAEGVTEDIAPPPPPPPPPAAPAPQKFRGDNLVSSKKVKMARIDDYAAAFPAMMTNQKVRDAMDKVATQMARAGTVEIPGVTIWEDVAVSNR